MNPLLLVTESKGTASSLHYGEFPLDAFSTGGTLSCVLPRFFCHICGRLNKPHVMWHLWLGRFACKISVVFTLLLSLPWDHPRN